MVVVVDGNWDIIVGILIILFVDLGVMICVYFVVMDVEGKVMGDVSIGEDKVNCMVEVKVISGILMCMVLF